MLALRQPPQTAPAHAPKGGLPGEQMGCRHTQTGLMTNHHDRTLTMAWPLRPLDGVQQIRNLASGRQSRLQRRDRTGDSLQCSRCGPRPLSRADREEEHRGQTLAKPIGHAGRLTMA